MVGRSPPPGMNIVLAMQIENLVEYEAASIIVDKDIEESEQISLAMNSS